MNRYGKEILPYKAGYEQDMSRTKIISKYLGDYSLSRITSELLSEYRDQRLLIVSPQTIIHELGLINRVLKTCRLDWGITCPLPLVRKPKRPRGRDRRLSKEEESTLVAALSRTPTVRTIMQLALETAMRRGEILGTVTLIFNLDDCCGAFENVFTDINFQSVSSRLSPRPAG
jgi:integrase